MDKQPKEQTYNIKKEEPQKEEIIDNFDLYGLVTNIHSPVSPITRDFTLAKLTTDVIRQPLPKFITNQIKTMQIIKDYLHITDANLKKHYKKNWENKKAEMEHIIASIQDLIMNEIYSIVIMSRSANGEILESILTHNHTPEEAERIMETQQEPTIKDKIMEKRK